MHGVGTELVPADWPAFTLDEVTPVLARYGLAAVAVAWVSPRPLSAAGLVELDNGQVFVKRHSAVVRSASALHEEHGFAEHLLDKGCGVPRLLRTLDGESAPASDGWTWEVLEPAVGEDLYRETQSWQPFWSVSHAFSAGAALARLQAAAADYEAPTRPARLLVTSTQAVLSPDIEAGLEQFVADRPMLADALRSRRWRTEVAEVLGPLHHRLAPYVDHLPSGWTHGDGHASNLFWSPDGEVSAVIDFGLADRTTPIVDLATALERNVISWLDPVPVVRLDLAEALIDGWRSVRALTGAEATALPELLPLVHVEFALSEMAYFHGVTGSGANADVAYETYLLGHARWHAGPDGEALRRRLREHLLP